MILDYRTGVLATMIARSFGSSDLQPSDFFSSLKTAPEKTKVMTVEETIERVAWFNALLGGVDNRANKIVG